RISPLPIPRRTPIPAVRLLPRATGSRLVRSSPPPLRPSPPPARSLPLARKSRGRTAASGARRPPARFTAVHGRADRSQKKRHSAANSSSNLPKGLLSPSPVMKSARSVLACARALWGGWGVADQYASFLPKALRQPSTEPPAPEAEPDVKEMIRVGGDTLFTAHPTAVAV